MCQGLRPLQQSMTAYAGQFDARTLTAAQAGEVVRLCAQIEASAASIKALAAARAAEARTWQADGYRSAADQLADQAGMSPAAAKRALETGRRLADQPEVAAAALAGDLSAEQATAIADGVAADPAQAAHLIDTAQHSSLPELNEEVAKVKAAARDQEQRRPTPPHQTVPAPLDRPRRRLPRPPVRPPRRRRPPVAHARPHPPPPQHPPPPTGADPTNPSTPSTTTPSSPWPPSPPATTTPNSPWPTSSTSACSPNSTPPRPPAHPATPASPTAHRRPPTGPTAGRRHRPPAAIPTCSPPSTPPPTADRSPLPTPMPPTPMPPTPTPAADARRGRRGRCRPVGRPLHPGRRQLTAPSRVAGPRNWPAARSGSWSASTSTPSYAACALDGELCEIAGYGPVPVSVVEDLLATENPFIIGILTKAQALVGVYHHGRHPNAHQRSALDFLYPTCAAQGCSSRHGLQYDHRHDYAKTHYTAFDLLDRLCRHHHAKKTHDDWALIEGHGKRAFVPPDDPRHPHHTTPTPDPPP